MGTPEQPPTPDRWPSLQAALHQTAIDWEILDRRETRYVLAKLEDFQEDLDFLRKRRAEYAETPLLIDSDRLPDRRLANDSIRFNRAYRKNLEMRLAWEADRATLIREVLNENERLYRIWDAIRDAKCDFHYVTTRRVALRKLRDLIGPDAFASAEPPPCVPDWRFAQLP
jgi:hypothetical protein